MLTHDPELVRPTSNSLSLSPSDLARLLARAGVTPRRFLARQAIDFGANPRQLAIILQGAISMGVEIEDGYTVEAALAGTGDWLGWPASPPKALFTGVLDGELGFVSRDALLNEAAALGYSAPDVLALAASATHRAWTNLACQGRHSITQRLARRLLDISRLGGGLDTIPMTQDEAALALGVQRTSVTHAAVKLQEVGAVRVVRARTIITDRAALERLACSCAHRANAAREASL
ncbi:Crp/Fnr family transcriptional regulator [Caulobacter sp. 73W]|uniref:Crp/Fnr family transcriptional regulator n=1 Tax=Caulobacter sp. 73W TaxID=3161137 RepID=A0AB39KX08_9CAUL